MAKLIVYKNRDHLFNYYLEGDETIIGRSQDADVPLDSQAVSRRHVRIKRQGSTYVAEDLSNKNGMFINGKYTNVHFLKDGDRIEVAQHMLIFQRPPSEVAQEQRKAEPGGQMLMSSSQLEKVLDDSAEKAGKAVDPLEAAQATTMLSGEDLHKLRQATARRRSAHLAFHHGGTLHQCPLEGRVLRIGWSQDCDLRLPGRPLIGQVAAQVIPAENGSYRLEALVFWPPIKVGGKKVKVHVLGDEDVIEIGGLKIRFRAAAL